VTGKGWGPYLLVGHGASISQQTYDPSPVIIVVVIDPTLVICKGSFC